MGGGLLLLLRFHAGLIDRWDGKVWWRRGPCAVLAAAAAHAALCCACHARSCVRYTCCTLLCTPSPWFCSRRAPACPPGAAGDYVILGLDSRSSGDGTGEGRGIGGRRPAAGRAGPGRERDCSLPGCLPACLKAAAHLLRPRAALSCCAACTALTRPPLHALHVRVCRGRAAAGAEQAGAPAAGQLQQAAGAGGGAPQRICHRGGPAGPW